MRAPLGDLLRLAIVRGLDDVEAAEHLLGLGVGTVRDVDAAAAVGRIQRPPSSVSLCPPTILPASRTLWPQAR